MFKATLFVLDKEYPLLDINYNLNQKADQTGRPIGRTFGGKLFVKFASTRDDAFFYEAMFSPNLMIEGKIRIFRRDGIQKAFDIEFANAFVVHLKEHFNGSSTQPCYMEVVISPLIQKIRDSIFELPTNPSNPFIQQAAPTVRDDGKKLERYYLTDKEGNEIEDYENGQVIVLNIETKNYNGEKISINLNDKEHDFKLDGVTQRNDTIRDYVISKDHEKIELEVIPEQQEPTNES